MTDNQNTITYEKVATVASRMLAQGINPTNRNVRELTGGRSEKVAEYLSDFNTKRNNEVASLADKIGSSEIGKLIAGEMQNAIERRTKDLTDIKDRQSDEIKELIELLNEKEQECSERVRVTEADTRAELEKMQNKLDNALARANKAEAETQAATELAKKAKEDASNLVESAKAEARSLVAAADKQTDKADAEAVLLREQVKILSVDEAKRELEKAEFENTQNEVQRLRIELADVKTQLVRLESNKQSLEKEVNRFEADIIEFKADAKTLSKAQAQLVETQKQISELKNTLSQTEREKDSLSRALAVQENRK